MGIVISHDSEYGKELARWEQHRTGFVGPDQAPGNPYVKRPFPTMLYRAQLFNGKQLCMMPMPQPYQFSGLPREQATQEYERAMLMAESFNRSCQRIVQSESEKERAASEGWRESPQAAIEHLEALEQDIANAAAQAHFGVKKMSEGAQREFAQADADTEHHVVDVQPTRNARGRVKRSGARGVTHKDA